MQYVGNVVAGTDMSLKLHIKDTFVILFYDPLCQETDRRPEVYLFQTFHEA